MSVAPVIFGTRHGEAVAEPIELLGIDPIDAKTAFQQGFDDRAVGHFDGHPNDLGRGAGAGNQPIAQLLDPRAAMRNGSLAQAFSAGIDQANLVALARPVDADKPCNLFRHARSSLASLHPGRRNERQSLYWRSKRNLPRDFRRGRPAGGQVLSRCSKHRIRGLLPVGRPWSASLQYPQANTRVEGYRYSNCFSLSRGCRLICAEGGGPSGRSERSKRAIRVSRGTSGS